VEVFGLPISLGDMDDTLLKLSYLSELDIGSFVCLCNVHMLVEAHDNPSFHRIVASSDLVLPDGMPIAKLAGFFSGTFQSRIAGMDLIESLFGWSAKHKKRIFLYGSTEITLAATIAKVNEVFPSIELVGSFSPPFRTILDDESVEIINLINSTRPDFVLVFLGCPKQEKWMFDHKQVISSCMIGLGGAIDVYSGRIDRAPEWMQKFALEWLYRLYREPRRLFKRYLYTNTKFVFLIIAWFLKSKLKK
jgi:N-acetylglucosaminyldiphosphoundecaprenol N-acetyl-beta-D-mannosaminyltransferase